MKQKVITNVFDSWEETIIWSCLQGAMGAVYTNDEEDAAQAISVLKWLFRANWVISR